MNINNKKNIFLALLFVLMPFFSVNVQAAYTESNIGSYSSELAKFPSTYKSKIEALHNIYPNAIFVMQDKFFDWGEKKEVSVDWNRMLDSEHKSNGRSLLYNTYPEGYRATDSWAYNYYTNAYTRFDNGNWYAAAKNTIAYYMDARNFLDSKYVFMFESNLYHDYQNESGVEKILSGTFMSNKNCPGSSKTYAQVILEAGKNNDISPYMLASRLRQEQGTAGTSDLISGKYSGYTGYYNYFNVKASGTGHTAIVTNGLKYAKEQGWNSAYKSIIGGAGFIKKEYVGINDQYNVKGQLTGYLQKFDPYGYKLAGHQYMQNITAHYSEASTTYSSYISQNNYKNFRYIFYIPVYSNMPSSTALPNPNNPNNYLKSLTVNGNSVSGFDGNKTSYTYTVSSSTNRVYIDYTKVASTSSVSGAGNVNLNGNSTKINITVTAGNGAKKTYTVTVNKSSTGTISPGEIMRSANVKNDGTYISGISIGTTGNTIKNKLQSVSSSASISVSRTGSLVTGDKVTVKSGNETKTYYIVIYGDVNGDGAIKAGDYVFIKNKIMGNKYLSGAYLKAADVNRDGKVTASDYVLIKNSIMGKYKISQ